MRRLNEVVKEIDILILQMNQNILSCEEKLKLLKKKMKNEKSIGSKKRN
jgi:hypothetical protein